MAAKVLHQTTERVARLFRIDTETSPAPPNDDGKWPWNIDKIYTMLTAKKRGKDLLDDVFAPPLYKYHTLERTTLGYGQILARTRLLLTSSCPVNR